MKKVFKAVNAIVFAFAMAAQAQAAPVTWGVNATVGSTSVAGSVTFDDASVQGFFDGIADPADTHVTGDFVLSSTGVLGWTNSLFTGVLFQPYFYSDWGDGPHVDVIFNSNNDWVLSLNNSNLAVLFDTATGAEEQGTWSFSRSQAVPEPASLALVAFGLLAIGARRRPK